MSIKFARSANALIHIIHNYVSSFHSLEVVGGASETQLEIGENLNYFSVLLNAIRVHF